MKLVERLAAIGYSSYDAYLESPYWLGFRARHRASGRQQTCLVCGAARVELHHVTYCRLGAERLEDVIPLCRGHHRDVHEYLKVAGRFVEDSLWAVARLRGEDVPDRPSLLGADGRRLKKQPKAVGPKGARPKRQLSKGAAKRKARKQAREAALREQLRIKNEEKVRRLNDGGRRQVEWEAEQARQRERDAELAPRRQANEALRAAMEAARPPRQTPRKAAPRPLHKQRGAGVRP